MEATNPGNIYGSTFPNSPGWTNILSGTNLGGQISTRLNTKSEYNDMEY